MKSRPAVDVARGGSTTERAEIKTDWVKSVRPLMRDEKVGTFDLGHNSLAQTLKQDNSPPTTLLSL